MEPVCHSLHVLRPSHCPICRNEQRRKPHDDVYSQRTRTPTHNIRLQDMFRARCICTPQGVPVALFLTNLFEVAKFQDVKTKAYSYAFYVYVSHPCFSPCRASGKSSFCKSKHLIVNEKQKMEKLLKKRPNTLLNTASFAEIKCFGTASITQS